MLPRLKHLQLSLNLPADEPRAAKMLNTLNSQTMPACASVCVETPKPYVKKPLPIEVSFVPSSLFAPMCPK